MATEPVRLGPHRLGGTYPTKTTRPALFTALRTGFARQLLQEAFTATRELRAQRRAVWGAAGGGGSGGAGKPPAGGAPPWPPRAYHQTTPGGVSLPAVHRGGAAGPPH